MNLLDALGIEPEDFRWEMLALCNGMDTNLFYEKYESNQNTAKQIDQMCLHCPVMKQCAKKGMDGQTGVWGGVYWNGAGRPDNARNEHKTPEIWEEIKERLSDTDD